MTLGSDEELDGLVEVDQPDVVLLAGKGHESYQEVAGVKHPFSDIGSASLALEHRK